MDKGWGGGIDYLPSLQHAANVNTLVLDCRLGPTLSCLVAEKGKTSNQLLFCHNNKSLHSPSFLLNIPSSTSFTSPFTTYPFSPYSFTSSASPPWPLLLHLDLNRGLCYCGRKIADLKIYLFSATKQDRVGPSVLSRNTLFTSACWCTNCTVELEL